MINGYVIKKERNFCCSCQSPLFKLVNQDFKESISVLKYRRDGLKRRVKVIMCDRLAQIQTVREINSHCEEDANESRCQVYQSSELSFVCVISIEVQFHGSAEDVKF